MLTTGFLYLVHSSLTGSRVLFAAVALAVPECWLWISVNWLGPDDRKSPSDRVWTYYATMFLKSLRIFRNNYLGSETAKDSIYIFSRIRIQYWILKTFDIVNQSSNWVCTFEVHPWSWRPASTNLQSPRKEMEVTVTNLNLMIVEERMSKYLKTLIIVWIGHNQFLRYSKKLHLISENFR